jgi:hypothetical protein
MKAIPRMWASAHEQTKSPATLTDVCFLRSSRHGADSRVSGAIIRRFKIGDPEIGAPNLLVAAENHRNSAMEPMPRALIASGCRRTETTSPISKHIKSSPSTNGPG